MQRLAELRQQQASIMASIEGILRKPREEKRGLNTEETAAYDTAYSDMSGVQKAIQAEELLESRARDAAKAEERRLEADLRSKHEPDAEEEMRAFRRFLRFGDSGITPEEREILRAANELRIAGKDPEFRALASGTAAAGGYTVPEAMETRIVEKMLHYGGAVEAVRACGGEILTTASGNPIPWPTVADTTSGALLSENSDADTDTALDTAFGEVTLGAYTFTSGLVKVSNLLLQDAGVNIDQLLTGILGTRLGRIFNNKLTVGTNSSQPQGIVAASSLGKTAASATAITNAELLDLIHSVDIAYRERARFMFSDGTLKLLLKLVDGNSLPIFQPSFRDAAPATINGYPFTVNNDMPAATTGLKSVLFGDFSYLKIRMVGGIVLRRAVERFVEANQTAYVAFSRMDSKYIDAGGGAVKHLIQA